MKIAIAIRDLLRGFFITLGTILIGGFILIAFIDIIGIKNTLIGIGIIFPILFSIMPLEELNKK